jgi:hypothetical protein
VVVEVEENGDVVYYLPCYVRFLVKEIKSVDVETMEATVSGALLFSFYYGKVDRALVDLFVGESAETAILLEFNQEDSVVLKEDKGVTRKEDDRERVVNFTVRQNFRANLKGNVFLTPFEMLDIYLSVIVQTVHTRRAGPKTSFKFNCMDSSEVDVLSHGDSLSFGYYRIATHYLDAKYSNSRTYPFAEALCLAGERAAAEVEENFRCFQFAHFRVPIYKFPGISILTIFIPIWIIGLIGLFVFFQEAAFGARLATVAVLALAFVAFVPTINASVPRTPEVKLVDILILMELAAVILLLVESFNGRFSDAADFDWQNSPLFLASVALNAATFAIVLLLFLVHKCFWERGYKQQRDRQGKVSKKLARQVWENQECDEVFSRLSGRLKLKNL